MGILCLFSGRHLKNRQNLHIFRQFFVDFATIIFIVAKFWQENEKSQMIANFQEWSDSIYDA